MVTPISGKVIPRRKDSPDWFLAYVSVNLKEGISINNIVIKDGPKGPYAEFNHVKSRAGNKFADVTGEASTGILGAAEGIYREAMKQHPGATYPEFKEINVELKE